MDDNTPNLIFAGQDSAPLSPYSPKGETMAFFSLVLAVFALINTGSLLLSAFRAQSLNVGLLDNWETALAYSTAGLCVALLSRGGRSFRKLALLALILSSICFLFILPGFIVRSVAESATIVEEYQKSWETGEFYSYPPADSDESVPGYDSVLPGESKDL